MTNQNPFLSKSFKSIWLKHFTSKSDEVKSFKFFSELEFVKFNSSLVYVNVGETYTKGVGYNLNSGCDSDLNNKTVLVYDVPTYFELDTTQLGQKIKLLKSKQYPGFLIETSKYKSLNDYMLDNFNRNSRNKNNKYKRRLEESFNISYKMFYGDISKSEYDFIFKAFKLLLEKRFADKQITNNNLDPKEWSFYYEVAFPLILEKKASLFVVYDNDKPIGVTLSYLSNNTLFDAITVFDIDYFKFHLGSVTIMKLIEWCIDNGMENLDFSKGYFEYKSRWCTKQYDFEYHIFYDSTSVTSKVLASTLKSKYDLKQKLREKKLNETLHKLTHRFTEKESEKTEKVTYQFSDINLSEKEEDCTLVDFKSGKNRALKLMIFEFLYLYQENYNHIQLFQLKNHKNSYLIKGHKKSISVTVKD